MIAPGLSHPGQIFSDSPHGEEPKRTRPQSANPNEQCAMWLFIYYYLLFEEE